MDGKTLGTLFEKIQRSSTDFVRRDQFTSLIMYDRAYHSPAFQEFLKNPEAVFQNPESKILKAGRSSTVVQFRLDNRQLVVKRYNMKNLFHRLRRCLRKTVPNTLGPWRSACACSAFQPRGQLLLLKSIF